MLYAIVAVLSLSAGVYGGYEWGHAVATKAAAVAADLKQAAADVKKAL